MKILNILILDDDPTQLELLKLMFEKIEYPPCNPVFTSNEKDFFSELSQAPYDLVISDYFMPDITGREVLDKVKIEKPCCEVIILTSGTTTKEAIELMKMGAYDFLLKPISFEILKNRLNKIFELKNLIQENGSLLEQVKIKDVSFSSDIIFKSHKMEEVINIAARSAGTDSNVLIRGESGTGKELVARAIHFSSPRKDKPFITINIATLPETLVESELFGHIKGSYTGAESERIGRFEEAKDGTIFIDEAGDIPLTIQIKLLRLIQFGEFQKVGSNITNKVSVRIIAATSRNLEEMIQTGSFREDLFYRLNVIPINIPPLRKRKEDISLLINYFLKIKSEKQNKETALLTDETNDLLMNYSYPGNIRELENIIEYSIAIARGKYITSKELPAILQSEKKFQEDTLQIKTTDYTANMALFETNLVNEALNTAEGNQSAAARSLGISERKLRSRMEILEIQNTFR
ncbi:MAG: sigma-54 dependent transcriptional regulator [Spirochaetia bacterium]|jgi:DNA-binding NtrC family response regulator|nr:sigma-54 dependent transcriptional regulator [Spirochaetia bacterium]